MSSPDNDEKDSSSALLQGLTETLQRTEASLLPAVVDHSNNEAPGLDFMNVKNSLVLTYLIELTHSLRQRLLPGEQSAHSAPDRLQLTTTVLDKSRGLDKKLRYQMDKLLAANSATTFASGSENAPEDPLQFRPDVEAMDDDEKGNNNDDDESEEDSHPEDDNDEGDEDEDDELAAARMTVAKSRGGGKLKKDNVDDEDNDNNDESGVYRAPRWTSVPYTHDKVDQEAQREKRALRRMRASELAQSLRATYGQAPEQEDTQGGSALGVQREAARRMAEREKEKEQYEEDNMVRLITSRKEKKERKRLMREENSNLAAIADTGNLVRDSEWGDRRNSTSQGQEDIFESKRHGNGKRKKHLIDGDGKAVAGKRRKSVEAKNSLQEALYGGKGGGRGGGKKKGKKRQSYP